MIAGGDIPLLRQLSELRALRRNWAAGRPLGLVATMGDLHAGHLRLVERAASLGPVVVSIFVNPTQFGPGEDFAAYPRDLNSDLAKLATLELPIAVFAPEPEELYSAEDGTRVDVGAVSEPLCGVHRPGHFRGVATVVAKLFGAVQPDFAVFGEKDAQQCLVLRRLVVDLCMPVELLFVPTLREADGLAMSSRNRYLDPEQRTLAAKLWQALLAGEACLAAGERDATQVEQQMRAVVGKIPLDYAQARSLPNLETVQSCEGAILLAIAARFGRARLIDNLALAVEPGSLRRTALLATHTESAVRQRLRRAGFRIDGGEST